jgi:hypothetical protein
VLIPALAGPKAADIELKTHVVKKVRSKYGDDLQVISFQHKKIANTPMCATGVAGINSSDTAQRAKIKIAKYKCNSCQWNQGIPRD